MSPEDEIVWLTEERCFARLLQMNAYYSTVKYTRDGIDYEVQVANDEFDFREDNELE